MWPIALGHAIGNGTNGTSGWFLVFAFVSVAAVFGAVIWRTSSRFIETSRTRGAISK
jgi:predicted methyltransferase MtxX (methanogen marker protein 4)